jgi:MYXO-CTERM domain-containing protein
LPDGQSFVVGAIAPDDPSTLVLRVEPKEAASAGSDTVYRSTDGGQSFQAVLSVPAALTGLAYGASGSLLWASSAAALYRSTDGGANFVTAATAGTAGAPTMRCLTVRGGVVYVCADPVMDGYAAARSADNGATFTPVLAYSSLNGPLVCGAGTPVTDSCGPLWPMLAAQLGAPVTPVVPDGGPLTDGGLLADTGRGGGGGGCSVAGGEGGAPLGLLLVGALAALFLRRSVARSAGCRPR